MVEEWSLEPSSTNATPTDVDAVGKGELNQGKGMSQSREKTKSTTDKNTPSSKVSVVTVARKATSGRLPETSGRSERQESPCR